MLERCATRGDHDAVVEGEAVAHLRRLPPESVDVIIAADVLAYVGDCAELFGEARRVLRTNGRLVFTLEESDEAGFGLGSGGRFVHSEVYLRGAAAAADLMVVALDRGPMRSQGGTPVVALIAALAPIL
jgi:predicted TPR repeat methyltransferase